MSPTRLLVERRRSQMEFLVNTVLIRRLRPTDSIDDMTSMLHRAFSRLGRMGLRCGAVDQPAEVTLERAERGDCYVAIEDEKIIGTMTLQAPARRSGCPWYRNDHVASLHQLAVDPRDQGRGCGKALLSVAMRWARERGYREIALDTPADAAHLIEFYRAQGFRAVASFQRPDKSYRSAVLSKGVAPLPRACGYALHRGGWQAGVRA